MFAASKTAAAPTSSAVSDPQFNYVTMLLHGDGTNGAQNNTFVDSSTNNFTITRNGTPTQGSFSPYGDLWSNFFSGTQYFVLGGQSAFSFDADFTIEMWFNAAGAGTGTPKLYESRGSGQEGVYVTIEHSGTSLVFRMSSAARITTTFSYNTWNHVALVRSSGVITMYLNGVSAGTYSTSATTLVGTSRPCIGAYPGFDNFNGYISNLRVVKGTALYTSNFTPSTTPLTAVSGTSLLTCQSNRFRDASSNNFAITVTGTPSVQRFSPFDPAAEYSTSVIGGSGYFGGSSQYLSATSNSSLDISTGDFTVEFFVNPASITTGVVVGFTNGAFISSATQLAFAIYFSGSSLIVRVYYGASFSAIATVSVPVSAWAHIALVRSGNVFTVYRNGVSAGTATLAITLNYGSGWKVGVGSFVGDSQNGYLNGYVSDLRIVKGTAVYTANFTPPTAPLTAITNTSLLLNTVNAGIFDNAMTNDLVTVGDAQISTAVVKYGTGSMKFDGTGDYLTATNTLPFVFGTGNWTIETWVNPSVRQLQRIYDSRPTSTNGAYMTIGMNASGNFDYTANSALRITGTTVASTGTWYHVAVCRSGTSTRLFVNGVQEGVTYTDSTNYIVAAGRPFIGADSFSAGSTPWSGYMDDFRVTKGYARYTANFTPPPAAFPNN